MRQLLQLSNPYELVTKWHNETPRPGSSFTITPWESEFQNAIDREIKLKIAANKTHKRTTARLVESPKRSPRMESHMSIDNPMTATKINQLEFHDGSSPKSIPEQNPRTHRTIEAKVRMTSVMRPKEMVKLPNLTKLRILPVKFGLRGKKLNDKVRVEQLIHAYSPRPQNASVTLQKTSDTIHQEIVPINLRQEFSRRKGNNSWLGARREDVMTKLYSQIRSTIRLA